MSEPIQQYIIDRLNQTRGAIAKLKPAPVTMADIHVQTPV